MRASVQKIDSYSWLDDDLYGPQALKLTPPPRICSGNISTALYPESAEWFRRKTDYLYRSEELRVCVSTSIREAIMGHAWNVMVSASPPWGSNKQNLRQADSCFCWRSCKLWRLLAEDKINTWGHWGEDNHVVCTTRLSGKLMSKAIFINSNGTKTAESIPYWWETRRCEK